MDKWGRIIHNIESQYDPQGEFDESFRSFKRDLEQQKKEAKSISGTTLAGA